ncbi:hypothetical protein WN944_012847 [Citrus x changshan-huyou]|uniref:DUF7890 domain-containing protein n=1 Tax=Citrus x changshan-huyou TaxID=2935761 RepID=A0AAP0M2Z5_9ROSI
MGRNDGVPFDFGLCAGGPNIKAYYFYLALWVGPGLDLPSIDAYLIKNKKPKKGDADDGGKLERRSRHASSASTAVAEEKIGSGIRVKVRMTKAEAARLLSKCKEGGVLGFKDVENELVQIPMNRVHVLPPATTTTYTCAAVLKSIPEEP